VKRCGGELQIEKIHVQDVTHDIAHTMRCDKSRRHKFFVVERVGTPIRMMDDTRWEHK
jgi:hypothetical protein